MTVTASIGGEVLNPDAERAVEGFRGAETYPVAVATDSPTAWNESSQGVTGSRVGWELRSGGKLLKDSEGNPCRFAWRINPQSITRQVGSRTTMFGTKRAFYVDDFGPGAETIQIQQLIATGGMQPNGSYVSLRDAVLHFYKEVYLKAIGTGYKNPVETYFYDAHLFDGTAGPGEQPTVPEQVYFPANGFTLERSVSLNNVWRCTISMVSLEKQLPTKGKTTSKPGTVMTICDADEDLHHYTRRILKARGEKNPSSKRVQALEKKLRSLNPILNTGGKITTYYQESGRQHATDVPVKRMHVIKGEKILLPT